jgi:hypothetical protein
MSAGATVTSPDDALERTDRILRRLLRQINDSDLAINEELGLEIKRAKRQLRANNGVLETIKSKADS